LFVNRLRFRKVKPLDRDIPEGGGEFSEPARKRVLLQGGNGSGKTTILETIATLWEFWGEWIELGKGNGPPRHQLRHFLANADLAAMEVDSVLPEMRPMWIAMGAHSAWADLREAYPDHAFAGLHRSGHDWHIELPSLMGTDLPFVRIQTLLRLPVARPIAGQPIITTTGRPQSVLPTEVFANVVFFPSEERNILRPKKPRAELLDMIPYNWLARFDRKINLDSVLLTVKAREPKRFEECLKFVNLALGHRGKRITGFGESGRLVVEGEAESGQSYQHAIENLSSGEKQMLLMVGFTVAFLREGGIVLIDEPDLHIHISMVAQLMETLELIVRQRGGQLIAASHSELVWERFSRDAERVELNPWRRGGACATRLAN